MISPIGPNGGACPSIDVMGDVSLTNLISESIDVVMNDLGEAWNVKYIPKHKI